MHIFRIYYSLDQHYPAELASQATPKAAHTQHYFHKPRLLLRRFNMASCWWHWTFWNLIVSFIWYLTFVLTVRTTVTITLGSAELCSCLVYITVQQLQCCR